MHTQLPAVGDNSDGDSVGCNHGDRDSVDQPHADPVCGARHPDTEASPDTTTETVNCYPDAHPIEPSTLDRAGVRREPTLHGRRDSGVTDTTYGKPATRRARQRTGPDRTSSGQNPAETAQR